MKALTLALFLSLFLLQVDAPVKPLPTPSTGWPTREGRWHMAANGHAGVLLWTGDDNATGCGRPIASCKLSAVVIPSPCTLKELTKTPCMHTPEGRPNLLSSVVDRPHQNGQNARQCFSPLFFPIPNGHWK